MTTPNPADPARSAGAQATTAGTHRWGYSRWIPALGAAALAGGIGWFLLAVPGRDRTVALVLIAFGFLALVGGWRLQQRLTADQVGIVVRSLVGSRRIPWAEVQSVAAVAHRRLGTTGRLLELNLRDDSLLAFSSIELGTDCEDVAGTLAGLHAAAGR